MRKNKQNIRKQEIGKNKTQCKVERICTGSFLSEKGVELCILGILSRKDLVETTGNSGLIQLEEQGAIGGYMGLFSDNTKKTFKICLLFPLI